VVLLLHSVFDAGDAEVGVHLDRGLGAVGLRDVRLVGGPFRVVLDAVDGRSRDGTLRGGRHLGRGVTGEQGFGDAVRGVTALTRVRRGPRRRGGRRGGRRGRRVGL